MAAGLKGPARRRTPLDRGVEGRLRDRIVRLLEDGSLEPDEWSRRMGVLEAEAGPLAYSVLLYVLAHLDLPPTRARACWEQVLVEWRGLGARLGEAVDLRVAALQYFLRRERRLQNPAIVELRILRRAEDSGLVDELTRLYNFRHFQDRLREEVRRACRYETPLSLLMADADDFKAYNDTSGHLAGNAALRRLAEVLKRSVREVDIVARYGGEEFAILLPNTPKAGALRVAEKVRLAVERARIGAAAGPPGLTVSIGLACLPGDASEPDLLVDCADRALYLAKGHGKNRVESFSDERREHTRVDAALYGRFRRLAEESRPLVTSNLSDGGLMFTTTEQLEVGGLVQVRLELPPPEGPVEGVLRIARVIPGAEGYQVGASFIHMPRADRRLFRAHLARRSAPQALHGAVVPVAATA